VLEYVPALQWQALPKAEPSPHPRPLPWPSRLSRSTGATSRRLEAPQGGGCHAELAVRTVISVNGIGHQTDLSAPSSPSPLRGGTKRVGVPSTSNEFAATPTRLPPPRPLPWPFPLKSLHRSDLPLTGRSKAPQGGGTGSRAAPSSPPPLRGGIKGGGPCHWRSAGGATPTPCRTPATAVAFSAQIAPPERFDPDGSLQSPSRGRGCLPHARLYSLFAIRYSLFATSRLPLAACPTYPRPRRPRLSSPIRVPKRDHDEWLGRGDRVGWWSHHPRLDSFGGRPQILGAATAAPALRRPGQGPGCPRRGVTAAQLRTAGRRWFRLCRPSRAVTGSGGAHKAA